MLKGKSHFISQCWAVTPWLRWCLFFFKNTPLSHDLCKIASALYGLEIRALTFEKWHFKIIQCANMNNIGGKFIWMSKILKHINRHVHISLEPELSFLKAMQLHLSRCSNIVESATKINQPKLPLKIPQVCKETLKSPKLENQNDSLKMWWFCVYYPKW